MGGGRIFESSPYVFANRFFSSPIRASGSIWCTNLLKTFFSDHHARSLLGPNLIYHSKFPTCNFGTIWCPFSSQIGLWDRCDAKKLQENWSDDHCCVALEFLCAKNSSKIAKPVKLVSSADLFIKWRDENWNFLVHIFGRWK